MCGISKQMYVFCYSVHSMILVTLTISLLENSDIIWIWLEFAANTVFFICLLTHNEMFYFLIYE